MPPKPNDMPPQQSDVVALIADVQARFHDRHRIDLPLLVDLARAYEWRGGSPALAERIATLAVALEAHMREEEARLFPMMAQGGHALLRPLIDDMHAQHVLHGAEVMRIQSMLATEQAEPAAEAQLSALRAAARKFLEDLAEHTRIEDERLFAMFSRKAS
jgi:regulator of cell morphogenesis and NO signaling